MTLLLKSVVTEESMGCETPSPSPVPQSGTPSPTCLRRGFGRQVGWERAGVRGSCRVGCGPLSKGLCKNYFRFWRERHRARCEARGRECIRSDTRPTENEADRPGAAPPRRAGGLWLAGFVAPRSQTAAGMLPRRASPASQIPSSKTGITFCTDPKESSCCAVQRRHLARRRLSGTPARVQRKRFDDMFPRSEAEPR